MAKAAKPSSKKKEARSVAKKAQAYKPRSPNKKRQIVVPKPDVDYVDSSKLKDADLVDELDLELDLAGAWGFQRSLEPPQVCGQL